MKPSERIAEIKEELIGNDWVMFGGNRFSHEGWLFMHEDNPEYLMKAVIQYLDEVAQQSVVKVEG